MAAPSVSGITVRNVFTGTLGTLTGSVGNSRIDPVAGGLDGDGYTYIGFSVIASGGSNYSGWRATMTQMGITSPFDFSSTKLLVTYRHYYEASEVPTGVPQTRASRGVVFRMYSNSGATNYREWLLQGVDSNWLAYQRNALQWTTLILDPTDSSLANASVSFDASTIYAIEFMTAYSTGQYYGLGIDRLSTTTTGVTLTAGDSGTPGKFSDFYAYTDTTTIEQWITFNLISSYLFRLPILIGNGSTATRFDDSDTAIQLISPDSTSANPQIVILSSGYLGITINQSASCYFRSRRCLYTSQSKWLLTISGSTSATFSWEGGSINNVGTNSIGGAASFTGVTFSNCDQLLPSSGRTFSGCTITTSTGTVAAFNWSTTLTITGTSFTNNTTPSGAVRIATAGTYYTSANTFSGNTNDFYIDPAITTGTVTIAVDSATTTDKTWANTAAGVTANGVHNASGANVVFQLPVPTILVRVESAPIGASIGVFKRVSSQIADRSQFTLASGNNSGNSTLIVSASIPLDTPSSGYVRVLRDNGAEDRLAYSSYSGSTFTLSTTLPVSYTAGNGAYAGYLDVINSGTGTESNTIQYVADRDCVLVVRKGSGTGKIKEIRQDITLTYQDAIIPVQGVLDSINTQ